MSAEPAADTLDEPAGSTLPADRPFALRLSEWLRRLVDWTGRFGSWMALPLILITSYDIVVRKVRWVRDDGTVASLQLWLVENLGSWFGSTILQELEWHFHTALFALVLGYGYIWNTHVRVDVLREHLEFKKKVWIEFIGLNVFLIPYLLVLIYFASVYAWDSYQMGEISASTVGLTQRWFIKTVLVVGLLVALTAGIAVWLQVFLILFGPPSLRFPLMTLEWPEEEGTRIEGKERLNLEKAVDVMQERARDLGHLGERHH